MRKYDFMHLKVRHTNKEFPISLSLDNTKYPEQMDIIGSVIDITFRRKSNEISEYLTDEDVEVHRPIDDNEAFDSQESQEHHVKSYIETKPFIILRADNEDTYRLIAISEDMEDVLVTDSRYYDNPACNIICNQKKDWLGLPVFARYIQNFDDEIVEYTDSIPMNYFQDSTWLESYLISCDESEPCNAVMIQYINDRYYRVILNSECLIQIDSGMTDEQKVSINTAIMLYMNKQDFEYDAKTPEPLAIKFRDLNGAYPDDTAFKYFDAEGGNPRFGVLKVGDIEELLQDDEEDTDSGYDGYGYHKYIRELHSRILEGREPYGIQ